MKNKCTHPQDPANAIYQERTELLKTDLETRKIASHHACFEEVKEPDGKVYQRYVHEDCVVRTGVKW